MRNTMTTEDKTKRVSKKSAKMNREDRKEIAKTLGFSRVSSSWPKY
mgnify:CR=1 FL=1